MAIILCWKSFSQGKFQVVEEGKRYKYWLLLHSTMTGNDVKTNYRQTVGIYHIEGQTAGYKYRLKVNNLYRQSDT